MERGESVLGGGVVRRGALQGCRQRGRGGRTRLKGYVPFFF